jgi:hypothetical protein
VPLSLVMSLHAGDVAGIRRLVTSFAVRNFVVMNSSDVLVVTN